MKIKNKKWGKLFQFDKTRKIIFGILLIPFLTALISLLLHQVGVIYMYIIYVIPLLFAPGIISLWALSSDTIMLIYSIFFNLSAVFIISLPLSQLYKKIFKKQK